MMLYSNSPSQPITVESCVIAGNGNSTNFVLWTGSATQPPTVTATNSAIDSSADYTGTYTGGVAQGTPFSSLLLGALADNGGPTMTMLPDAASPLLNVGSNSQTLTTDQRGLSREYPTGQPDIGSVEVQPNAPSVTGIVVNNNLAQRSRLTTVRVTFSGSVTVSQFTGLGAITLTRTAVPTGTTTPIGTVVQTGATGANGLINVSQTGPSNTLDLTFAMADASATDNINFAVEYGSLGDGNWTLAIAPASYNSVTAGVPASELRRMYGNTNNDTTVDATDFGQFGNSFGGTFVPGVNPFDWNTDGTVDATDFGQFGNRFGRTL